MLILLFFLGNMVYNIVPKFYFHFLFLTQPVSVSPNHPQVTLYCTTLVTKLERLMRFYLLVDLWFL